jgi:hypothetical protein
MVRLTAWASFNRLAGLEGTYAVALTAPDTYLQQRLDATPRGGRRPALEICGSPDQSMASGAASPAFVETRYSGRIGVVG